MDILFSSLSLISLCVNIYFFFRATKDASCAKDLLKKAEDFLLQSNRLYERTLAFNAQLACPTSLNKKTSATKKELTKKTEPKTEKNHIKKQSRQDKMTIK